MPNKDGTGPNGQGSRTGRGMGKCEKNTVNNETANSGNSNLGKRNGGGCHKGRGLGSNGRNCQKGRGARCAEE